MHRFRLLLPFALCLWLLTLSVSAQNVRAVVVNDSANIRVAPAFGAKILSTVQAGFGFEIMNARTADSEWLRIDFGGEEAWVHVAPLSILDGSIDTLPVADPRYIPYGGYNSPRSGKTGAVGSVSGRADTGVRLRAGPGTAYPTLLNINTNQPMTITGRTASGRWYQVVFEKTLGWVSSQYIIITGGDITSLIVDGIVADAPPVLEDSEEAYLATLRMMRDRLELARQSLDAIRAAWTDAGLTGRAQCRNYPPQPSDVLIEFPVLTAFYDTLQPLQVDFNNAMFNIRKSIDLFIEVCNQPGTGNPVGRATVEGALATVNLADAQVNDLLSRISRLLPGDGPGANECLLTYNGKSEVLPIINIGTIYLDEFTRRSYATGYCFDGFANQAVNLQVLPLPGGNLTIFASVSPLDNPRSFLGVQQGATRLSVGPIILPRTGRYVIILADVAGAGRAAAPKGDFAVLLQDVTVAVTPQILAYDTATGAVILTTDASLALSGAATPAPNVTPSGESVPSACPSTAFTCTQLFTCEEARACLAAGNFSLDADNDGIPCEESLCAGQ
jgi:uncharacterized protein YraI